MFTDIAVGVLGWNAARDMETVAKPSPLESVKVGEMNVFVLKQTNIAR